MVNWRVRVLRSEQGIDVVMSRTQLSGRGGLAQHHVRI